MLLLLVLFILFVSNYIYPYKKKGENYLLEVGR